MLQVLGRNMEGTEELEESATCAEEALREITAERDLRMWSSTQSQLGLTHGFIAVRLGDANRARKGMDLCREVLAVLSAQRDPFERAVAELNLGEALGSLGRITRERSTLEEAIEFMSRSLEMFDAKNYERVWVAVSKQIADIRKLLAEASPS